MTIALVGAGGKMGCRLADNFRHTSHDLRYLEVSISGRDRLRARGIEQFDDERCIPDADIVILAVPDTTMGAIAARLVPLMKSGSLLMALDPAAPLDGQLPSRSDVGCVVAHPCHPSIFNWESTEEAFRDFYGGVSARQPIVCALLWGREADYERGAATAREMYAPVNRVHRVTVEQMAMLEPALVETLAQTCMEVIREGYDRLVAAGVPADAVRDFVLGHLRIQVAVLFGEVNGTFSDAAYRISKRARPILFRDGWQRIFEADDIRAQVRDITGGGPTT